jgi:trehalose 6-phosphate phosphatase
VVISGRALSDVTKRVRGLGLRGVVGNHGVEPWRATKQIHQRVQDWRPLFRKVLEGEPGVEIEDKTYSLAVHFRRSRAKKRVGRLVMRVAAELDDVRVIGGIEVVNIVPADAPHKGIALERERARLRCDTAIYVGDDQTDEDVFALDQPGRLLTVRVGRRPPRARISTSSPRPISTPFFAPSSAFARDGRGWAISSTRQGRFHETTRSAD